VKDIGLVGLPASGKSTLFTALTHVGAAGGRANQAVVEVPDDRLQVLAELERSKRIGHAQVRFVDVPGGLSTQAEAAMRAVDALGIVLDAFTGTRDPVADLAAVQAELLLADLAIAESSAEKAERKMKGKDTEAAAEAGRLRTARELLEAERPLRDGPFDEADRRSMRGFGFLSLKPWVVLVNLEEGAGIPSGLPGDAVGVYASIEAEVATMEPAEAAELLAEFGVEQPGLSSVITAGYGALDLITFLTTGEDETRAWQVRRGALAPEAAGVIHSDMERGFIRAEVVSYEELVDAGSMKAARERGVIRTEGKTYAVREGDIVNILFAV
jgi:ribosome-binding ATPase YchF (GTP1/OBG family)